MAKNENTKTGMSSKTNEQQLQVNNLAAALSKLFGAEVVTKEEFDAVNKEKQKLLKTTKDLKETKHLFFKYYCHFLGFKNYHSKWKLTTKRIEKNTQTLVEEKLLINYDIVYDDLKENLEEAYKCFIHGQDMACYIMLLRTIEISMNHIYDPVMNPEKKFIAAKQKLDWMKKNGYLSGADFFVMKGFIEGRNEAIHEVFRPTRKQLFSAFETVTNMILKMTGDLSKSGNVLKNQ